MFCATIAEQSIALWVLTIFLVFAHQDFVFVAIKTTYRGDRYT